MRVLIELVCELPMDFIRETFPEFVRLKRLVRVPLILLLSCAGILSGLCTAIAKVIGESIATNKQYFSWFILYLTVSGISAILMELYLMNVAMKIYRQIEVVPVFESMVIIFTITAGLVLFDESSYYSWLELSGILGSAVLVLIGIVVLTFKHNVVKDKDAGSPLLVLGNTLESEGAEIDTIAKARRDKCLQVMKKVLR